MKKGQRGFTLIELLISVAIMAAIGATAAMAVNQVSKGTEYSNNSITAVRQVQNAGYSIRKDVLRAHGIVTDNLTAPEFLIVNWTEWDENDEPIYHTATYSIEDLDNDIGTLTRSHWSSDGLNQKTTIAEYVYYNLGDSVNRTEVSYDCPQLTLKLTAIFQGDRESREYIITRRPTF